MHIVIKIWGIYKYQYIWIFYDLIFCIYSHYFIVHNLPIQHNHNHTQVNPQMVHILLHNLNHLMEISVTLGMNNKPPALPPIIPLLNTHNIQSPST